MIVTPNLHFNSECEQALKLYEKAFNGKLTLLMRYSDADPADMPATLSEKERDLIYHAEMTIGSQRFFFSDSLTSIPYGRNVSVVITFDHVNDVKAAYELLIEGGSAITPLSYTTYSTCFASLVDRFGVRWEIMAETDAE